MHQEFSKIIDIDWIWCYRNRIFFVLNHSSLRMELNARTCLKTRLKYSRLLNFISPCFCPSATKIKRWTERILMRGKRQSTWNISLRNSVQRSKEKFAFPPLGFPLSTQLPGTRVFCFCFPPQFQNTQGESFVFSFSFFPLKFDGTERKKRVLRVCERI